ncbi:hypothetical protein NQ318_018642 [Aromia moschata]|uniref:Peptidase aspartic putative domain-containing protein n=1 Tax=Aromia moschata TaxID=1265417 RepID=A0AAV8ZHW0_9CUCU|nr:hypothetical protein NQ318_018642 [Aromia moschata]
MPKFSGSYENWLEFRETFESLVHQNEALTPIQRYHYLRASLEGSAAQVIKSVEFTAAGYEVAWQTLCDRYNNAKLLVHNHIKSIFSLDIITKETSGKIRKLVDDLSKHLRSVEQLKQNIENWDPLLIFITASKLDPKTLVEWEKYSAEIEIPTLENLKMFLRSRADLLETIEYRTNSKSINEDKRRESKQNSRSLLSTSISCYYCKKEHAIYSCEEFKNLAVDKRIEFVRKARLCANCLRDNHVTKKCKIGPCTRCKSWHNTLLHQDDHEKNTSRASESNSERQEPKATVLSSGIGKLTPSYVLLSTARVQVFDRFEKPHFARVLLDSGSQSCFITKSMCERLGLQQENANLSVFGISNARSKIQKKCDVNINSLHSDFHANITCFILSEITNVYPKFSVSTRALNIPPDLNLADPEFDKSGPIDILIGAELFWILLKSNKKTCGKNNPILQETELGWIISGLVGEACAQTKNLM